MYKLAALGITTGILAVIAILGYQAHQASQESSATLRERQQYCEQIEEWQKLGGSEGPDPDLLAAGSGDPATYASWCKKHQ
ncbi:hypothetical protein [Modicisalibacter sp. 'Wilcox']|uniref:hypothetical protein n=1 Tax=Modicisalibacter sp. 'Wilcox' TaxID=2679914 RepID=UPI0013D1CC9E|nr:hypothetical protein [Modicisalibacter sp. 'Wilcox']